MGEQDGTQSSTLQRPANDNKAAWKAYWKEQGQSWRTEPEIETERQKYLTELRTTTPSIEQGIYPFKDMKLSRPDVEWLLATHDNGCGPVDRNDKNWWKRAGLDLRGADLGAVNLSGLPLAQTKGGLYGEEWENATEEQRAIAGIHLESANLSRAHLEGAKLSSAHLEGAKLSDAHLEFADLREAFFDPHSKLNNIILSANKYGTAFLSSVHWGGADLSVVDWASVKMLGEEYEARRNKTDDGHKKGANTQIKQYRNAVRAYDQLALALKEQGLHENVAQFSYRRYVAQRKILLHQLLQRSEDSETIMFFLGVFVMVITVIFLFLFVLSISPIFLHIIELWLLPSMVVMALLMSGSILRWTMQMEHRGNIPALVYSLRFLGAMLLLACPLILPLVYLPPLFVSFISWTGNHFVAARVIQTLLLTLLLGLLLLARLSRTTSRNRLLFPHWIATTFSWFYEYFHNLSSYGKYFFLLFLDVLVGYGYKPGRTIMAYVLVIMGFDIAYYSIGQAIGLPLSPVGSLVFSVSSFHGRGFFPGSTHGSSIPLDDPLTVLAACEAVIGLFIEVSFIAAFTQRFFGK